MRINKATTIFLLFVSILLSCNINSKKQIDIIPTPQHLKVSAGFFTITPTTSIVVSENNQQVEEYLQNRLQTATGFDIKLAHDNHQNSIIFSADNLPQDMDTESYSLKVTPQNIELRAKSNVGFFYAVQTLFQLLPPEIFNNAKTENIDWQAPCLSIEDSPKYHWRGFMLDSGRQFQTVDFIKRYLDILALLKINVFHWHLTEGQGWRIEIKQYPKLTEIGSGVATGEQQHGFYTQEDIREVVQYAKSRFITVVPEIDLPGHCEAALIAYPELSCFNNAPESVMTYSPNLVCAGKEATYTFIENVLDEVCELFPGEYIHLGGDEAPKDNWDKCPRCQQKIKEEGLPDSHELQVYFSKRLASYLKQKGKKVIFWGDVVYQPGEPLPDNVIVYWWNSRGHGDLAYRNAIERGHNIICGTNAYCYLNYPVVPWSQYDSTRTFDLKTTYEQNPSDLKNPNELLLGMECCLWTDWFVKMNMIDQRVFPRIYSLAEQMWSTGERLPFDEFYAKIKQTYKRLQIMGIDYGPAMAAEVPEGYKWD